MAPHDGPNYDLQNRPVCRYCAVQLDRSDQLAMESGYCSDQCKQAHDPDGDDTDPDQLRTRRP